MQFFKDLAYKSIEEVGEANEKRKRAEADTDAERLKRRRDNLETLVGYVEDEKTLDNARVQKVIDKLVEIETEFLKDGYKEEELKKGYEDMYSANTIGEKIGEVNERLKEVQTKYAKLS